MNREQNSSSLGLRLLFLVGIISLVASVLSFYLFFYTSLRREAFLTIEYVMLICLFVAFVFKYASNRVIQSLQSEEKKYRTLFESVPVGVFSLQNGIFQDCNEKGCAIFGCDYQEIIGRSPADFSPAVQPNGENSAKTAAKIIAKVTREGSHAFLWQHQKKDGMLIDTEVSLNAIEIEGDPFILGCVIDVTNKKRIQKALEVRNELLQLFVLHAPAAVAMFDTNMRYLLVSDRWYEDYGLNHGQIIGKSHYEVFPEIENMPEWREIHRQCLQGSVIKREEDPFTRANGQVEWVKWELRPWRNSGGEIGGIIMFTEVITEKKRFQQKIVELNERLEQRVRERTKDLQAANQEFRNSQQELTKTMRFSQHILDSLSASIVVLNQRGEIIFVNEEWRRFARENGLHWSDYGIDKNYLQICDNAKENSEEAAIASQKIRELIAGEREKFSLEYPCHSPQQQRWFAMRASRFHSKAATRVVISHENITERKIAEQSIEEARRVAESASVAKSQFLANMSHEIRTPMNAIKGFAELIQKTNLTPKQREYIQKIAISTDSLLAIVNDILDVSKIEADKLALEPKNFHLRELLDALAALFTDQTIKKDFELVIFLKSDIPDALIGDALRLRQILINLLGNAIKFTEQGEVCLKITAIRESQDSVSLQFSVQDTGTGIPSEQIGQIFLPFTQVDDSSTRKFSGTGLGLAISQKLLRLMDSELWVESEQGKGTTFSFVVELSKQTRQKALYHVDGIQSKTLVVEKDGNSRTAVVEMLRFFGIEAHEASTREEALDKLRAKTTTDSPYRLLLLDIKPPYSDSISMLYEIKKDPSLRDLKIVGMSGFVFEEELNKNVHSAFAGFLKKPLQMAVLFDILVDIANGPGKSNSAPQKLSLKEQVQQKLAGAKILLVEDNEISQQLMVELFNAVDLRTEVANDGKEAIEKITTTAFDLVFMDIQMPKMDGYEVTKTIRRDPTYDTLPIVALTANAMLEDQERCINAGVNDYLRKPIEVEKLFAMLLKWVQFTRPEPCDAASFIKENRPTMDDREFESAKKTQQKAPELATDEERRLSALCHLCILDTPPEERFDRFTRIAQRLFEMPIVLISLVDRERQWFKSRCGLDITETSRAISFCGHAILEDFIMVINDAQRDERFCDNPLVTGPPYIRFYAGCPLYTSENYKIGTLCLIDDKARNLSIEELQLLQDLAKAVEDQINVAQFAELQQEIELRRELDKKKLHSKALDFPLLSGVDTQQGLARASGNKKLYRDILVKFAKKYARAGEQIETALATGEIDRAASLLHTIKGTAGNIGAIVLKTAAAELEQALRDEDEIAKRELSTAFSNTLASVIGSITVIAKPAELLSKGDSSHSPWNQLLSSLKLLDDPLQKGLPKKCTAALEKILQLSWPGDFRQDLSTIEDLVKEYRFKDAHMILARLLSGLRVLEEENDGIG